MRPTLSLIRREFAAYFAGPVGYVAPGSPGAVLNGRLERAGRSAQINTFGGGVNEVQREIVAATGLKMVRTAR